jgi:hypothetical protein
MAFSRYLSRAGMPPFAKRPSPKTNSPEPLLRIVLPEHVKAEAAKATFKDGVLEIAIPVIPVPEVTKRTLEIQG